jgi:hypothetical protein
LKTVAVTTSGLLDVMGIITAEATDNPEPQPIVPWWSFSKTVLAAAALVLVDRRKLDLEVSAARAPFTLRHLLQHTSGLPDYGPDPDYHRAVAGGESPWTIDELLRRVNASTLLFAPGTRFSYCLFFLCDSLCSTLAISVAFVANPSWCASWLTRPRQNSSRLGPPKNLTARRCGGW